MFQNGYKILTGQKLECDVCIVGAGAAGITLALELSQLSLDVILVEAGKLRGSSKTQKLYEGTVNNPDKHLPLDSDRHRVLGGTTALWGGRCIPYDEVDFKPRDFVPHSGWPIELKDLLPFYKRAHVYSECGDYDYNSNTALADYQQGIIPYFADGELITNSIERWSAPTHFGKKYRSQLENRPNLRVIYNTLCSKIVCNNNGKDIKKIVCRTLKNNQFSIQAKITILSGGGLEVTRLLLHSNNVYKNGIGNHSDWLGRGYMCHLNGSLARVKFNKDLDVIFGYELDRNGIYCRRRLVISKQAQLKHKLLNSYMLLDRPLFSEPEHGSGILSLAFFAKKLFQGKRQKEPAKGKYGLYWRHFKNILSGSPEILSVLPKWSRSRFVQGRRIPSLIFKSKNNVYNLYYQAEQIPSRENRVSLSKDLDETGMAKLSVNFSVSDVDVDSIYRTHCLVDQELRTQGLGALEFESDDPKGDIRKHMAVLGHHIGTTRMSSDPECGVVDSNCKIHGLSNLYISSASVFPTSSQANPTLTVIAMSIRLGEHIKAKFLHK